MVPLFKLDEFLLKGNYSGSILIEMLLWRRGVLGAHDHIRIRAGADVRCCDSIFNSERQGGLSSFLT